MAYFSNSSEGMAFDDECSECALFDSPCPIAFVQMDFNYEACNNKTATAILNALVKQGKDGEYLGCTMKAFVDKLVPAKKLADTPLFDEVQ